MHIHHPLLLLCYLHFSITVDSFSLFGSFCNPVLDAPLGVFGYICDPGISLYFYLLFVILLWYHYNIFFASYIV